MKQLWKISELRVCADGGANRLFDVSLPAERVPDIIVGDLDSLHQHVRSEYESNGTKIIEIADQNQHDLDKALQAVATHGGTLPDGINAGDMTVLVLGAFGGRFDHEMAAIQTLYRHTHRFDRLILVGDTALAELMVSFFLILDLVYVSDAKLRCNVP